MLLAAAVLLAPATVVSNLLIAIPSFALGCALALLSVGARVRASLSVERNERHE